MAIVQHLIVDEYGVHLGKHSQRVFVDDAKARLEMFDLLGKAPACLTHCLCELYR